MTATFGCHSEPMSLAKTVSSVSPAPLGRLLAVYHPGSAELIDQHAETGGPEGLLDRHPHRPVLHQSVKYALGVGRIFDVDRYRKTFGSLIALRWGVGAHQYFVADHQ